MKRGEVAESCCCTDFAEGNVSTAVNLEKNVIAHQTNFEAKARIFSDAASPRYVPCPVGPGICVFRLKRVENHYHPDGSLWYTVYYRECLNCGGMDYDMYFA